jgi:SSS family solute:Na+ symporter
MIDLGVVLAFVGYSILVGLRARRRASRNLAEYFLAGRSISGWRAGLSMAATQFAADTPLLVMGLLAVGGAFSLWRLWIYGLAFLLMGFFLGAAWRRAGVLTDAELTMIRYSARGALTLRALKAVYYGTVINCVVMAFVLVAAVRIFELFLPWHEWLPGSLYHPLVSLAQSTGLTLASGATGLPGDVATANNVLSILFMLAFVALYSTTGGLRGVIATDVMQLAVMLLGTAIYAAVAVHQAGGRDAMLAALQTTYGAEAAQRFVSFSPAAGDALLPFVTIIALQWFFQMNSDGTGYLAQRTMACRDDRQARIAAVTFTLVQVVLRSVLWLAIGIALLVVFPFDAGAPLNETLISQRETLFLRGIDELLPIGARGLMLTGMLAALASTLDTHLNWGASYWSNDLYRGVWLEHVRRRQPRPGELVRVARLSGIGLLLIALAIMANLGSIQRAWQISLLFGAGIGGVLVLRWLWERVNLYCEIAAMAVSLLVAPPLMLYVERSDLQLLAMAVISTAAVLLAAFALPGTEPERLTQFYRRVRPPGWWRQTARAAGLDPAAGRQALRRDLLAFAACAVSVYAWLVGLGKLLLQPAATATAVALLALGAAAAPIWIRALARSATASA